MHVRFFEIFALLGAQILVYISWICYSHYVETVDIFYFFSRMEKQTQQPLMKTVMTLLCPDSVEVHVTKDHPRYVVYFLSRERLYPSLTKGCGRCIR